MRPSFIPYLTLNDYLTTIRSDQLNNQILDYVDEGGDFERRQSEAFAMDEVRSVLGSYFYLDFEFRPLLPYSAIKKYNAGDRVILDFPYWVAGSNSESESDSEEQVGYKEGDCVILESDLRAYICKNPNNDISFVIGNWILLGKQYDIFFVNFPYDIFQLNPSPQIGTTTPGLYTANKSRVCWEKNVYLCRNNSWIIGHQAREQYYNVNDFPSPNMFPNTVDSNYTDGNRQWIDKGEFFLKNVNPSYPDISKEDENVDIDAWTEQYRPSWTLGDNRNATMKEIIVSLSIWKLMSRNSFMLKERAIQRDLAYRKLTDIRKGEVTTLIPILQPEQVGDISWGGSPRIVNTF